MPAADLGLGGCCGDCKSSKRTKRAQSDDGKRAFVSWERTLVHRLLIDANNVYHIRHRLKPEDIPALPCTAEKGDMGARIVPIDFCMCVSSGNAVIVSETVAKMLRQVCLEGDLGFYQHVLSYHYTAPFKPVELVAVRPPVSQAREISKTSDF
eukprot:2928290-Rhodomonas_salina.1